MHEDPCSRQYRTVWIPAEDAAAEHARLEPQLHTWVDNTDGSAFARYCEPVDGDERPGGTAGSVGRAPQPTGGEDGARARRPVRLRHLAQRPWPPDQGRST